MDRLPSGNSLLLERWSLAAGTASLVSDTPVRRAGFAAPAYWVPSVPEGSWRHATPRRCEWQENLERSCDRELRRRALAPGHRSTPPYRYGRGQRRRTRTARRPEQIGRW